MNIMFKQALAATIVSGLMLTCWGGDTAPSAANPVARPDLSWYRDSGFGMFLHWGAYAQLAGRWQGQERIRDLWGEWAMNRAEISIADYEAMARGFKPTAFDPAAWAAAAKAAGMGWMVLTAKHHDGFAMYRSQVSTYNIVEHSGSSRDPVRELNQAARQAGLRFGVYYSQRVDWHNGAVNDQKSQEFEAYFNNLCVPQVRELLTGCGPLDVMWFDIGVDRLHAEVLHQEVRKLAPQTLICGRICSDGGAGISDFKSTGDCEVPVKAPEGAWETCMTLTEHWGWYPQDTHHKTAGDVIRMLAEVRSKGGCLLLNIGPDNLGRLPPRDHAILRQIGAWMRGNGASIRGVTASPLAEVPWGFVTRAADRLYLHVPEWPVSGRLVLPGVRGNITKAWLLGDPGQQALATCRLNALDLGITMDAATAPLGAVDPMDTVVVVELAPGATFDTVKRIDDDWANRLRPSCAIASPGLTRKNLRSVSTSDLDPAIEVARHDDVAYMTNPGDVLTWTVRVPAAGDYHVLSELACDGVPTGAVEVTLGSLALKAAPKTGSWSNPHTRFLAQRLGTVSLPANEAMTVTMTVSGMDPKTTMLVKGLVLVPTRTTPQ